LVSVSSDEVFVQSAAYSCSC